MDQLRSFPLVRDRQFTCARCGKAKEEIRGAFAVNYETLPPESKTHEFRDANVRQTKYQFTGFHVGFCCTNCHRIYRTQNFFLLTGAGIYCYFALQADNILFFLSGFLGILVFAFALAHQFAADEQAADEVFKSSLAGKLSGNKTLSRSAMKKLKDRQFSNALLGISVAIAEEKARAQKTTR